MHLAKRLRPRLPRRLRSMSGQSLVEFVLIAPVLLLMLLITIDFGRLFLSYVTLTNVTRVAANFASTDPASFVNNPKKLTTFDVVVGHETPGLNCDLQPDADGNNPPAPNIVGNGLSAKAQVQMTCNFTILTPLIGGFFPGGVLPISSEADFPVRVGAIANIGGTTTLPPPGAPIADFTFTNVTGGTVDASGNVNGTPPVTVNVTDASANAQTWHWDWGDTTTEDVQAPNAHQYNAANTYTVTLTVTNTQGSSSKSRTVTLTNTPPPPPVAGFYGTPQGSAPQAQGGGPGPNFTPIRGSKTLTVNFSNTSTNATSYSWDFGDGSAPDTTAQPQHAYNAIGVYTVALTITTPTGAPGLTRQDYVTVGCLAPNFANTSTATATSAWSGAGFTGAITFQPVGANGNKNKSSTPPSPPKQIASQEGTNGGELYDPTRKNKNAPWECANTVNIRYTP